MTGWGRTGTRFACEQASVAPDILCLSKGLTGGFLPMGVTLATEEIYQAFYSTDRAKTFFHSSSFTGNPLACAAACASLQVGRTSRSVERIGRIQQDLAALSPRLQRRADVESVRQTGTILALDVARPRRAISPPCHRSSIAISFRPACCCGRSGSRSMCCRPTARRARTLNLSSRGSKARSTHLPRANFSSPPVSLFGRRSAAASSRDPTITLV